MVKLINRIIFFRLKKRWWTLKKWVNGNRPPVRFHPTESSSLTVLVWTGVTLSQLVLKWMNSVAYNFFFALLGKRPLKNISCACPFFDLSWKFLPYFWGAKVIADFRASETRCGGLLTGLEANFTVHEKRGLELANKSNLVRSSTAIISLNTELKRLDSLYRPDYTSMVWRKQAPHLVRKLCDRFQHVVESFRKKARAELQACLKSKLMACKPPSQDSNCFFMAAINMWR